MKFLLTFIFLLSFTLVVSAQSDIKIKGTIVELSSGTAVEFATISIYSKKDSSLIAGGLSELEGKFEIVSKNVPSYAMVEFLSFASKTITIIPSKNGVLDLGEITLEPSAVAIDEIEVTAQKSTSQFMLDRKVFNVGQDLGSRGGTAIDLLNNVPSLSVDVEGNINLRGNNNVRILINGRPSGLVGLSGSNGLRSIPANMIERVEVITNPSARYEAEGMTGIINIILKKDAKGGFNGSFEVTGGLPNEQAVGANVNYRKGMTNTFVNYNIRKRRTPGSAFSYLERFGESTTDVLFTDRILDRGNLTQALRSGLDFYITDKQVITGALSYSYENGTNNNQVTYKNKIFTNGLVDRSAVESLKDYIFRGNAESSTSPRLEYSLDYKKDFERQGKILTANLQYNDVKETERNTFEEFNFINDANVGKSLDQRATNAEGDNNLNFQTDFVQPLGKDGRFETGLRTTNRNITNDYLIEEKTGEVWRNIESLSNNFEYEEHVHAAYGIYSNKGKKYSYQFGMRYEYSDVTTRLIATNQINPRTYDNWFPSGFFNYQITPNDQLQVSYSKRIRRPGFRSLNPFYSFTDRINFFTGNPDLDPEYTDSYELGFLKYWDNANLGATSYFRRTSDVVSRIKTLESDGTTLTRPTNLGFEDNTGVELLAAYSGIKWYKIDGDINIFYNKFFGTSQGGLFDSETFATNMRLNQRFTFWKKAELQLRWNYAGPRRVPQGTSEAFTSFDLAFSKDFSKDLTMTIGIRDVFNQRRYNYTRLTDTFADEGSFQFARNSGNITLNYRINAKKEKPKARQGGGEGEGGVY